MNHNNFNNLHSFIRLLTGVIFFVVVNDFTLLAQDQLTIVSSSKAEKHCMKKWRETCSKEKLTKEDFLTCTKEEMDPGCKSILTKLIQSEKKLKSHQEQMMGNAAFQKCHEKLLGFCPPDKFPEDLARAKCLEGNFNRLDKDCQKIIKYFFKRGAKPMPPAPPSTNSKR